MTGKLFVAIEGVVNIRVAQWEKLTEAQREELVEMVERRADGTRELVQEFLANTLEGGGK